MRQCICIALLVAVMAATTPAWGQCIATGDADCSGTITINDAAVLIQAFEWHDGTQLCWSEVDFNGDCIVDRSDFEAWIECLGPEPPDCPQTPTCCDPVVNLSCCQGAMRGDANGVGGDVPTIGDISVLIDCKFLLIWPAQCTACYDEADVNESASVFPATEDDITIGDISILIDYLFITSPALWDQGYGVGMLPPCPIYIPPPPEG